jgi:8-oxo-dGTP pyrophosphatase MutT (NUDIX family)
VTAAPGSTGAGRSDLPGWLTALAGAAARMSVPPALQPQQAGGRPAAVLILFGAGPAGPDLLLVQRNRWLRRHAGQPAFPGGAVDAGDGGPVATALREAAEEACVQTTGVQVVTVLPELFISRSGFLVTPVLAWWRRPGPVAPGDPAEIAAVTRVPIADLADPANRLSVRFPVRASAAAAASAPPSPPAGPAFRAGGMLIWGFTGFLIDRLIDLGGWERPWDASRAEDLPPDALAAAGGIEPGL